MSKRCYSGGSIISVSAAHLYEARVQIINERCEVKHKRDSRSQGRILGSFGSIDKVKTHQQQEMKISGFTPSIFIHEWVWKSFK